MHVRDITLRILPEVYSVCRYYFCYPHGFHGGGIWLYRIIKPLCARSFCLAADGAEHGINQAIGNLADEFRLPEEDRSQLLPSGLGTVLANRVSWAKTYLMKAGALEKTRRAHFRITDRGRDLLREYPEGVNSQTLRKFPEFMAFQQPSEDVPPEKRGPVEAPRSRETSPETPEEAIQRAESEITLALRENLFTRIHELSPTFFERLVVDLIVAMGYGGSREYVVQEIGKSSDQGIDGIVNEDVLGLDRVYIQAKRYAENNVVGREQIQQFAGALVGHAVSKGVFFTTSTFARTATEYAQKVPQRIVLIDGKMLTKLMVQYNIGVCRERAVELKRVDLDYFEEISE